MYSSRCMMLPGQKHNIFDLEWKASSHTPCGIHRWDITHNTSVRLCTDTDTSTRKLMHIILRRHVHPNTYYTIFQTYIHSSSLTLLHSMLWNFFASSLNTASEHFFLANSRPVAPNTLIRWCTCELASLNVCSCSSNNCNCGDSTNCCSDSSLSTGT